MLSPCQDNETFETYKITYLFSLKDFNHVFKSKVPQKVINAYINSWNFVRQNGEKQNKMKLLFLTCLIQLLTLVGMGNFNFT